MYELAHFDLANMVQCGAFLRATGAASASMEQVAERTVGHLHASLTDAEGRPACALVHFYKTHPHGGLPPALRAFADGVLGEAPPALGVKMAIHPFVGDRVFAAPVSRAA